LYILGDALLLQQSSRFAGKLRAIQKSHPAETPAWRTKEPSVSPGDTL
jgi:hypothetical protein